MIKQLVSALVILLVLISLAVPVLAQETMETEPTAVRELKIYTVEQFLMFADRCRLDTYSRNLYVSLERDIDLTDSQFAGIPIFSGVFNGNEHKISGLQINTSGSRQGLFRFLTEEARVENLWVSGEVSPEGSRNESGGIAGFNAGQIRNCRFVGSVSGGSCVGGLAGTNAVTGIIEHSHTEGSVSGGHFVGGIAGENFGVIRFCSSKAMVNTTPQQNRVEISDLTLDILTDTESVGTVTDIGGIAGISSGVIRSCKNYGDVGYQRMGYNIGGIAGTQSGYIVDCENSGNIRGRKEVGGIVGQMEPASRIEFSEDTLQILQGQLTSVTGLVTNASSNAQANANQVSGQIQTLKNQAQTARDAVDTILPDWEDPSLPDVDTILAAQNTLSDAVTGMPGTIRGIASATQNTVSSLSRDLKAISAQVGALGNTVNNASENLGGSITDISDLDTPELLTGKVENCTNLGAVLGDLNVGGIAGAMAMENDLDILEDWEQLGEESLNFQSEVRAVLLNCNNSGTVTGTKQNIGGIAGWQSLGLIKYCGNAGTVDAAGADYAGGISGMSSGYIRAAYARCRILGGMYVGGIAGSATVVSDSLSQVKLDEGEEKLGAILGTTGVLGLDREEQIVGNFYLPVDADIGAVDGISYSGQGEPLSFEKFMALAELPEMFKTVTVRFLFEDGSVKAVTIPSGGELKSSDIPAVPDKSGYTGVWGGLAEAELRDILFDMTFETVYSACSTAIQSAQTRDNGLSVLLVEGTFSEQAAVLLEQSVAVPILREGEELLESWQIGLNEPGSVVRFLLPEGADAETAVLYICSREGAWRESEFSRSGKYLVIPWESDDMYLVLVGKQTQSIPWLPMGIAGAVVLAAVAATLCARAAGKKKKAEILPEA